MCLKQFNYRSLIFLFKWSLEHNSINKNKTLYCINVDKRMNFMVREDNSCADGLTNIGLAISSFIWWHEALDPIRGYLDGNLLGMPKFRFVTFIICL